MANSYSKQIRDRIDSAVEGTIFVSSDFADIANTGTIRWNLNRLAQAGILHHVLKGVFQKPEYSELIKEYLVAYPVAVAKALARNYHWMIAPSGNTALNFLGLSAQVPAEWSFISEGRIRLIRGATQKSNLSIGRIRRSQDFLMSGFL